MFIDYNQGRAKQQEDTLLRILMSMLRCVKRPFHWKQFKAIIHA